ncbi:M15 family metallopeptidase [Allobranchiibius sp. GilTou38]|uniref:M15 family metallopeptidase n=1 Tax=Allobranchiibius sp. GilTou38 TaxID=2815210 RepID=UPI001AA11294|nr:M15 family metallopeptidase [Allobranchiibius sp. GilTou38]MBO1767072.1 M15 family metallopeptidase [Allobranchiibius sp. GilTou38]
MVIAIRRAAGAAIGIAALTALAAGPAQAAQPHPDASTQTATAPAAVRHSDSQVWTLYTGSAGASFRANSSNTATFVARPGTGYQFTGVLGSGSTAGWVQATSGTYTGQWISAYSVTTTNPAQPLGSGAGSSAVVSTPNVTRYVVTGWATPNIRASYSYRSAIVATVKQGVAFTGTYVNYAWFRITSGTYAGRFISTAMLQTSPNQASYNGVMPAAEMCAADSALGTSWEPTTPRYLACAARDSLANMNAAFKAAFGYNLSISEAYRPLVKQQFYYDLLGSQAAVPGTSNHGLGQAIDFDTQTTKGGSTSIYYWGTPQDKWLTANALNWGFQRPKEYSTPGVGEYWHYTFVG